MLEGPNLRVDGAPNILQLAVNDTDVEGLQLGAIHGCTGLPAAVARDVEEVGKCGTASAEEAAVVTVAHLRDDVGGVVGGAEANGCR